MASMTILFLLMLLANAGLDLFQAPTQGALWHTLRSMSGKFVTISGALLFFTLADAVMMHWLDIEDVLHARGKWAPDSPLHDLRWCVAGGWFMFACAVILGVSWGGAN